MSSLVDPCNPFYVSSSCMIVIGIIIFVQTMGSQTGMGCLPYTDYLKFVTLFILAYFTYVNVIKERPYRCGPDAIPMWSSICSSVMLFSIIIVAICAKFRGGMAGNILGYICTILGFCCTLCCVARLYNTNGPISGDFWNPNTLFTFKM